MAVRNPFNSREWSVWGDRFQEKEKPKAERRQSRKRAAKPKRTVTPSVRLAGADTEVTLGFYLPSRANQRLHFRLAAAQTAEQRERGRQAVYAAGLGADAAMGGRHVTVTMIRLSPRLLDDDNLQSAFKAMRDGIAEALGFKSDNDPLLTWQYAQQQAKAFGVRLLFRDR